MKGDLRIDDPAGERWDLALDVIERGENAVLIADRVQLSRWAAGPRADGMVHIAVLAGKDTAPPAAVAREQVAASRAYIESLLSKDGRFQELLERFGVAWEYVADDGIASWMLARITADGSLDPPVMPTTSAWSAAIDNRVRSCSAPLGYRRRARVIRIQYRR